MYCQHCGHSIRTSAKFCNRCGSKVKQRFGPGDPNAQRSRPREKRPQAPPPPAVPPSVQRAGEGATGPPPFAQHSWPGAENVIIMPVVASPVPAQPAPTQELPKPPPAREVDDGEMLTRFDLHKPATTGSSRAPDTGEIERAAAERARRVEEYKPFFTQVGTAVTNRQHNRVIMVVPLLLIVSLLLFLFAYIASK